MTSLQDYLAHYIEVLEFALVPVPAGQKAPMGIGWQRAPITSVREALQVMHRGGNLGLLHAQSGTAVFDVDHPAYTTLALRKVDIELDDLLAATGAKIIGAKGLKPLYRLPDGVELKRKVLTWHEPGAPKATTVFELRAGKVQDLLPPSIHPDTGQPYQWIPEMPKSRDEIPELPNCLRALWENW